MNFVMTLSGNFSIFIDLPEFHPHTLPYCDFINSFVDLTSIFQFSDNHRE